MQRTNAFSQSFKRGPRRQLSSCRSLNLGIQLDDSDSDRHTIRPFGTTAMESSSRRRATMDMSGSGSDRSVGSSLASSRRRLDQQLSFARKSSMMLRSGSRGPPLNRSMSGASAVPVRSPSGEDLGYGVVETEEATASPRFITFRRRKSNARRSTMAF